MQEWIVIDQFGNVLHQGLYDRSAAEMIAQSIPNARVEMKK